MLNIITSRGPDKRLSFFLGLLKKITITKESSSLKFCKLAEKKADIYIRLNSLNKWDIAAGHAIVNAMGGKVLTLKFNEINYGNKSVKTSPFFAFSSKKNINFIQDRYQIFTEQEKTKVVIMNKQLSSHRIFSFVSLIIFLYPFYLPYHSGLFFFF